MLAEILEFKLHSIAQMIAHAACHADAAWLGNPFKPRRDIDAVAENVAVLDHYVADIDADPEQHLFFRRQRLVGLGQRLLDRDGAAQRVDDAREFRKHAVAGSSGDLAAAFGDQFVDDWRDAPSASPACALRRHA